MRQVPEAARVSKPKPQKAVVFEIMPLVRIEIRGIPHPEGFPRCADDQGLVKKFLQWLIEHEPFQARGGSSGAGGFVGYFLPEDAARIRAWLLEQAVEVPATGGWR